jgi:hypothetical protein
MLNEETKWIALELSSQGERLASEGNLKKLLVSIGGIGDEDSIFVPYTSVRRDGESVILNVMEGYIFLDSSVDSGSIDKILRSHYISRTVSFVRGAYGTVPNHSVESLKLKLSEMVSSSFTEGETVRVNGGPMCGITGTLVSRGKNSSCVKIVMRSIEAIRSFSNYLLEPV